MLEKQWAIPGFSWRKSDHNLAFVIQLILQEFLLEGPWSRFLEELHFAPQPERSEFPYIISTQWSNVSPRWEGPLAATMLPAPTPHRAGERGSLLGKIHLLLLLHGPGVQGQERQEAEQQSAVRQRHGVSQNPGQGLREELTSAPACPQQLLAWALPNDMPGLTVLDGFGRRAQGNLIPVSHLQSLPPPLWETWMWAAANAQSALKHAVCLQAPLPWCCSELLASDHCCITDSSCSRKERKKRKKERKISTCKNSTFCKRSPTTPKLKMLASTASICQHIFDFLPKYSSQNFGEKKK